MDYPAEYRIQVLDAIHKIDLNKVGQVINIFKDARTHGRRIFVCGNGGVDAMAAQALSDIVNGASFNRSSRFRILALRDEARKFNRGQEQIADERVFVEQLKNFAEPEDVVMGICVSGDSPDIANAIEYASWIGCKTIGVTGFDGGKVGRLADVSICVSVSHLGSIEDSHVIICHMIGYYFADFEKPRTVPARFAEK